MEFFTVSMQPSKFLWLIFNEDYDLTALLSAVCFIVTPSFCKESGKMPISHLAFRDKVKNLIKHFSPVAPYISLEKSRFRFCNGGRMR